MKKFYLILILIFTFIACTKEESSPTNNYSREIHFSSSFKKFINEPEKFSEFFIEKDIIQFNHFDTWVKKDNNLKGGNKESITLIVREDLQSYKNALNDKFIALNLREVLKSNSTKNLSNPYKVLTTNNYELLVFDKRYIDQYGYEIFFLHNNTLYFLDCYVVEDSIILLENIEKVIMSLKLS